MRILVTGGAGFLGSHLCDRLIGDGHEVVCLDNLFTGRKENVAHLLAHPRFEFLRHDVVDPFKIEVDQIYNLACPASPPHYQYNPIKTVKTSVMGAINCLGLAKRVKARVLQASTSEVYGDPQVHPQPESYWGHVNPVGRRSCYDEGKRCAETLFFDYHRENRVDIRVARIFNTYGPRMLPNDGRVVSNFIVQALQGEPLTVYGDGSQTRSFCYVDDLIEGLVRLMAQTETVGPVNLGNPDEFSMLRLAELTLKLTGGKSKIVHRPLPADDPKQRQPDIARARKHLKWKPKVALEAGLERTIAYFRKRV
ncbi:MAG TPA: UDP-glucuronic acid decarboxylase family protein [Opitutaceae bacterium]|nr:UDP-glucuronic acid decarboxylase family protein [Opitutaceae bacterium]